MRLIKLSRIISNTAFPLLAFPAIAWAQGLLGWEVALFPLYMLPVAVLAWNFGTKGAVSGVLFGIAFWLGSSFITAQPFSYEWIRYYNAGVRGLVFAATGVFIILFKRVVEQHRARMEAMRTLLNVCHGCGSVQGSDGQWIPFEDLIGKKPAQTCECPKCTAAHKRTDS
jgi:hypothetical protein